MLNSPNIFLVGPMGSGKTAVGKSLARRLRLPFVDSDLEIERRTGVDIPLIFDKEGDAGFRNRERDVLAELVLQHGVVLSTGGGAILLAENREVLKTRGTVVYLNTSIEQQLSRVRSGENRPLLSGADDIGARLAGLMTHREPLYREVADLVVSTDEQRVGAVVEQILQRLTALRDGVTYT